jgi:hypothetical protein
MSRWIQGKVLAQRRWTERLISMTIDAQPIALTMRKHRRHAPGHLSMENTW